MCDAGKVEAKPTTNEIKKIKTETDGDTKMKTELLEGEDEKAVKQEANGALDKNGDYMMNEHLSTHYCERILTFVAGGALDSSFQNQAYAAGVGATAAYESPFVAKDWQDRALNCAKFLWDKVGVPHENNSDALAERAHQGPALHGRGRVAGEEQG